MEADSFTYNPVGIVRRAIITYMLAGPLIAVLTLFFAFGGKGASEGIIILLPFAYLIGSPIAAIMGAIFCIPIILSMNIRNNSWLKFLLLGPLWGAILGAAFAYLMPHQDAISLGIIGGFTCGSLTYFTCAKDES